MRKSRSVARLLVLASLSGAFVGCGSSTEVELANVPQVRAIQPRSPEQLTKRERARAGSTVGMTRDPSGVTQ